MILARKLRNLRLIPSEVLFFLENTMILGRKLKNLRLIPSENFFLENTTILGQKLVFIPESRAIFFPIRKVLENYDLENVI